jgi:hypothetical protein
MNWFIIAGIAIIAIIALKFKHIEHRFHSLKTLLLVLVLAFLIFSVGQLYLSHAIDLTTFDGIVAAGRIYFSWLGGFFHNIVKISGYAVNQDWGMNTSVLNFTK